MDAIPLRNLSAVFRGEIKLAINNRQMLLRYVKEHNRQ
jgi:hypothetical protein